ncbi:MAG: PPK2 family polyphosphate kinase [Pseudomonadota bacterium]
MTEIDNLQQFLYRAGHPLETALAQPMGKKEARKRLAALVDEFAELQERLYASDRHSLLLVFQGMDAAGKDSTIDKVTSGVNPAGFQVFNFKKPNSEELDHNFLWRCWRAVPERGRIGIFNRSHYEEVLVVRVHPGIVASRKLPDRRVDESFWQRRFDDINAMERHLANNGTRVLKFFLNVSKDEQKARFMSRLDNPEKNWKFSHSDLDERGHWDAYQYAFREMLSHTHSEHAPWFAIPADDKRSMRVIVASIIVKELKKLGLEYPSPDPADVQRYQEARERLNAE